MRGRLVRPYGARRVRFQGHSIVEQTIVRRRVQIELVHGTNQGRARSQGALDRGGQRVEHGQLWAAANLDDATGVLVTPLRGIKGEDDTMKIISHTFCPFKHSTPDV